MTARIIICIALTTVVLSASLGNGAGLSAEEAAQPAQQSKGVEWWLSEATKYAEQIETKEHAEIASARRIEDADIDRVDRVSALCAVAEVQAKDGPTNNAVKSLLEAEKIVQDIGPCMNGDYTAQNIALGTIGDAYANMTKYETAKHIARQCTVLRDGIPLLVRIATKESAAGKKSDAEKTFSDALALLEDKKIDATTRDRHLKTIACGQAEAGMFDGAAKTLKQMSTTSYPSFYHKLEALCAVAGTQAASRKKDEAVKTYAEAVQVAEKWNNRFEAVEQLIAIARRQFASGFQDDAVKTFSKALDVANGMEAEQKDSQVGRILGVEMDLGLFAEVEKAAIDNKWPKTGLLIAKAFALANAGNYDEVKKMLPDIDAAVGQIKDNQGKQSVLVSVAILRAQAGLFEDAMKAVETITWPAHKVRVICAVAKRQAETGDKEGASKSFAAACSLAAKTNDASMESSLLDDIIRAQITAGMLDEAMATAKKTGKGFGWQARQEIVDAEMKAKRFDDVVSIVKNMDDEDSAWKARILCELATELAKGGQDAKIADVYKSMPADTARGKTWFCIGVARGLAEKEHPKGKLSWSDGQFGISSSGWQMGK
jgi:tetratricopeptide (TPR) repeat protein